MITNCSAQFTTFNSPTQKQPHYTLVNINTTLTLSHERERMLLQLPCAIKCPKTRLTCASPYKHLITICNLGISRHGYSLLKFWRSIRWMKSNWITHWQRKVDAHFIGKILQKSGEAIYRCEDEKSSFQRNAEDVCIKNQSRSIRENCGQMYKESVIPPQSSKNLCALPSLHQWFTWILLFLPILELKTCRPGAFGLTQTSGKKIIDLHKRVDHPPPSKVNPQKEKSTFLIV